MAITQQDVDAITEKAMAPAEQAVTTQTEPIGIGGEADPSDFVTPIVSLVQGSSAEGTAGMFRSSAGTEKAKVRFVVLHIQRTRTFFLNDEGLVCRSNDRRTGYPKKPQFVADDAAENQPFECNVCPHYSDVGRDGCRMDFALTCYDLDAEEPFMFRVKGAALGVFKYRLINDVARGKKPPWFTQFVMISDKKSDKERGRNWYEPVLTPGDDFDADTLAQWASFAAPLAPIQRRDDILDPDDLPFE